MESYKRFSNKLNELFRDKVKLSFVNSVLSSVIIVTNADEVYEFKRRNLHSYSLLITSDHKTDPELLKQESIIEELCGKQVIDFKNGWYHTIARTVDGEIYCWGRNKSGALGNGRQDMIGDKIYKPEKNDNLSGKNIIDICCGAEHSLVLAIDGEIHAWGDNYSGQIGNGLGINDYPKHQLIPYLIKGFNGDKIKAIACGGWHSLALSEKGIVFSWGWNSSGQLGIGIKDLTCCSPKQIEMNGIIIEKISCGASHSLLLSRDGDIYVFGNNGKRQLGTDVDKEKQYTPKKLINSNKFIDIASHSLYSISIALSEKGLYHIWGEFGKEVIKEPKEAHFKSFDNIFEHYFQKNYKPIEKKIILFEDTFIRNGEYQRQFNELEKLGKGSYGDVFKVKEKSKGNDFYAIKKMKFKTNNETEFLKELETCSTFVLLAEERLLEYRKIWVEEDSIGDDFGLKNFTLYIQMELCEKTLRDIIEEMQVELNLERENCLTSLGYYIASELFIEILKGVQYLHKREEPLIHRDLKPDNILLKIDQKGKTCVKIGDFGLVAIHKNPEILINQTGNRELKSINLSHTTNRGDMSYAAPEALDDTKYNTKVDIYSLGVILKELFNIDSYRDYMNHKEYILATKYQALNGLSETMTYEQPDKRPNCEAILRNKHSWALNSYEFDARKEFECFTNSNKDKELYVLKLMQMKSDKVEKIIKYKEIHHLNKRHYNPSYLFHTRDDVYHRRYDELGKLGEGRYGEVIKVRDKGYRDAIHAMKKIRFCTDRESEFLKELETYFTIAILRDKRLVKYYDIWLQQDSIDEDLGLKNRTLYILMELCESTLKDFIGETKEDSNLYRKDHLTPWGYYMRSEMFIQILEGVHYLHKQKPPIIHRDLKPVNILIKNESIFEISVKIADFGLVGIHQYALKLVDQTENMGKKSINQLHTTYTSFNRYVAPEVLNGTTYNTKADIYSLGIILQDLFKIGIQRDNMEEESATSLHMLKYLSLRNLRSEMTNYKFDERPNSEDLLNNSAIWALNRSEYEQVIRTESDSRI